jgi:UDP:flavonoid glycosyltransferase YjiC (YdhE family)
MDPWRGTEVIVREMVVPSLGQSIDDLSTLVAGADLFIGHPLMYATPLVAERAGVPWLSVVLAPTSLFSVHDFPVLPPFPSVVRLARAAPWAARTFMRIARATTGPWTRPVREMRVRMGLADRGDPLYEGQYSPHGTLALFSRALGARQPDWPANTTQTGFIFHDGASGVPDHLRDFLAAGEAPIVFTLGSSAVGAPGSFYEHSIEAATRLGRRAVLLVGRNSGRAADSVPPHVCLVDYVPHAALFPHAAVIVHHGGAGTLGQALRAGRPMLVVPHAHDQHDNALRAVRIGVARALDARRFTARRASGELGALLAGRRYASASERVRQVLATENGPEAATRAMLDAVGAAGYR